MSCRRNERMPFRSSTLSIRRMPYASLCCSAAACAASTSAGVDTASLKRFCGPCSFCSPSTRTHTTVHGPPFERYCASGSGRITSMPRNSVRKRRVAGVSLHSSVPCESRSGVTSEADVIDNLPSRRLRVDLIALGAQRRVDQIGRAVLDLPPVRVPVDEVERVGAMAEARLLHPAETELLLLGVDLLVGLVDRGLARHEHAPVVEHLLRYRDLADLARLQHPVGLAGELFAWPVAALADQEHALLGLDAFEAEDALAHAAGAGEVARHERAGDQRVGFHVRSGRLGLRHRGGVHWLLLSSFRSIRRQIASPTDP